MISQITWRRMLYAATGLAVIVAVFVAMDVIPHVAKDALHAAKPTREAYAFWGVVIVHFLIVAALYWIVRVDMQGGKINKQLLLLAGVALFILGVLLANGAFTFYDHEELRDVAVRMFWGVAGDLMAGTLVIYARYAGHQLPVSK
jgi:hypothetical protein